MAFTITVPAADMRDRAVGTRKSLVAQYITPQKPFPLTTFAVSSSTTPTSPAATRTLISRGLLQTTGGHLTNRGTPFDAPFTIEMNGQNIRISVAIPGIIDWVVDSGDDHLTITRVPGQTPDSNPLIVTFIDKPLVGGVVVPIADRQILTQVDLRDLAMTYVLQDQSNPGNTLIIKLDFSGTVAPAQRKRPIKLPCLPLLVPVVATLLSLSACDKAPQAPAAFPGSITCNPSQLGSNGTTSCTISLFPSAPDGQQTVSLQSSTALLSVPATGSYSKPLETQKSCSNVAVPDGYAIVGYDQNFACSSDAMAFAELILQRYKDKNQGDKMEICYPPQQLPDNTWASRGVDNASLACRTYSAESPIPYPTIIVKTSGQGEPPPSVTFSVNSKIITANQQATISATLSGFQTGTTTLSLVP